MSVHFPIEGLSRRAVAGFAAALLPPAPRRTTDVRFPPEIAFLAGQGLPHDLLVRATKRARQVGVTADVALLAEGMLAEETFYRHLAAHLGLPFLERPVRPLRADGPESAVAAGGAPLAPNARGFTEIVAPRGAFLRALASGEHRFRAGGRPVVATPRQFASLVRSAAGESIARRGSHDLHERDPSWSALGGPSRAQVAFVCAFVGALAFGFGIDPSTTWQAVTCLSGLLFLAAILTRLFAIAAGEAPRRDPRARRRTPDHLLPTYTIVVPLFREARILRKLVSALDALDYPHAKLDIKIVLEACDGETIRAAARLRLPPRYEVIVAPPGLPRTKPRALNIALPFARGDLFVIYDAEDEPDPGQLRDAAEGFARGPANLACLQAKLAIDNTADGWLARLFTIEYSALFDAFNPGLAALRLPIPLGGTSNHFRTKALREVGGWDAWNVTEDADLGVRLARHGHAVATLDSSTFEEAPARFKAWLGQRRRWLKGWMQTLMVLTRQPVRLFGDLGFVPAALTLATLGAMVYGMLVGPLFMAAFGLAVADGSLLHPVTALEVAQSTLSCLVVLTGIVAAFGSCLLGLQRRGWLHLSGTLVLLPVYLCLLMVAAWGALLDACAAPHAWRKTEHGLARTSRRYSATADASGAAARPVSGLAGSQP